MISAGGIMVVVLLLIWAGLVILLPALMLTFCIRAFTRPCSTWTRINRVVVTLVSLVPMTLVVSYIVMVWPWQSGVLTQGTSPDGQEYCVVQTYKDLVEPYQVSFYLRGQDGTWYWDYLEHEDNSWRSAHVEFLKNEAVVYRNGEPFRRVKLPTTSYSDNDCPAHFTVHDILQFHNQEFE